LPLQIMEIINTGKLKRIDYERTELTVVSEIFRQIYGVGRYMVFRGYIKLIFRRASPGNEMVLSGFENIG
jgi:hypothetical protein